MVILASGGAFSVLAQNVAVRSELDKLALTRLNDPVVA
jgi:hypothetical protein